MTKKLSSVDPEQRLRLQEQAKSYREKNKTAISAYGAALHKEKYKNDPEYRARKDKQANICRVRKRYNLTPKCIELKLKLQENSCAICGGTLAFGYHIDHCHSTGKTRDILCAGCNLFVGKLESDPQRLERALDYIERHKNAID